MYSPATGHHVAHGAGEEAEAVGESRHLVLQDADARLAAIERLEGGERLGFGSMASASLNSRAERSAGVVRDQDWNAAAAASTAAST